MSAIAVNSIAIITVTYYPDVEILRTQLSQLPANALVIIVDNSPEASVNGKLEVLAKEFGALLIQNKENIGLAAATNQGIKLACEKGCVSVLLLDQDTEPGFGAIEKLQMLYQRLRGNGAVAGCIGPRMVDVETGLDHGFHRIRSWRWIRELPSPGSGAVINCASLNGSGTLIPIEILECLGGLDDDLFIDHVDTEWSFRVLSAGFGLYGAADVVFRHRMGERSMRFWWFGWRVWPYRSPLRHWYLCRNAMILMRRSYVPAVWKAWAIAKITVTFIVHAIFDNQRITQSKAMIRGILSGIGFASTGKGERCEKR